MSIFSRTRDIVAANFADLLDKVYQFLRNEIHLLILDLFPPTRRDPNGVHGAIWDAICEEPFSLPTDKPLTFVAYEMADAAVAYIEPAAVGDRLPDMPLFLEPGGHVLVPLEATYQTAWQRVPQRWRRVLENA